MIQQKAAERYLEAAALLPPHLRRPAERLCQSDQARAEELRLRAGSAMTVLFPEGEVPVAGMEAPIACRDLELVLEIATHASVHTAQAQLSNGFFTVDGGHRIGICGSGVMQGSQVRNLRQISSLAIRVAREVPGAAHPVLDKLWQDGVLLSTLVVSPPGGGKTTLLRDLIRSISDGDGCSALRVGVADERGELAAMYNGLPQLAVGSHTDIINACPKEKALLMLLRGLNPQVLAADEITAPEDCAALELAANCGVALLCTAHGTGLEDLNTRPLYRGLLERRIFRRLVVIGRTGQARRYQVTELC